ncbi:MAG: hypothetical protein H6977_06865 [Gammaproteobacteria bacterium]|nr:hypothetical protein [Planctomycetota bacterium]MCB1748691.1 hypothetical protein [Gammaproteobacteria bacterium]MCP5199714.1 hypothetical protein [Gammaproteobacteria bacterium]
MHRFTSHVALLLLVLLAAPSSQAATLVYLDEATYLGDLAGFGYTTVTEGFENAGVWGGVRSTSNGFHTAPAIVSQGITWAANYPGVGITTGSGAAVTGAYGFYSYPHGNYANHDGVTVDCTLPGTCGDGFVGSAAGPLFGVGGWFRSNTPPAALGLYLDGMPVDFGESCAGGNCSNNDALGTTPTFFGVIDTAGFGSFEYRETEGTRGDAKYIFADQFTLAVTAVPLPPAILLLLPALGLLGNRRRRG